jgi:alcohol dehydrogenase class IV
MAAAMIAGFASRRRIRFLPAAHANLIRRGYQFPDKHGLFAESLQPNVVEPKIPRRSGPFAELS